MKQFSKLALATAIAAVPATGFAMESLEDEALSAVTGQEGLRIEVANVSIGAIKIVDNDAFTSSSSSAGAIFISGFGLGTSAVQIDVDADDDTIQAAVNITAGTLTIGAISATATGATTGGTTLLDLGSLTHGGITANVQLGAEDQGAMIALTGSVTGGLTINNFAINDSDGAAGISGASAGSIGGDLSVTDNGGANLTLTGMTIDADGTHGLYIQGLNDLDVSITGLNLGTSQVAGDLYLLDVSVGDITIEGKL